MARRGIRHGLALLGVLAGALPAPGQDTASGGPGPGARPSGAPDPAGTAWDVPPRRPRPAPAGRTFPVPLAGTDEGSSAVALEVDPGRVLAQELAALAEAGRAAEVAQFLRARAVDPLTRARLVRDPLGGGALLGVQEDARRRLLALPPARLHEARAAWDLEAEGSLGAARGEAAARALLALHPGAGAGTDAARWLGERCLERGEVQDALLFFRRALALDPPPALARSLAQRLIGLRARPGGDLGPPRPPGPGPALRWARRFASPPLAAAGDEAAVFVVLADRLLALDREDGRVRWRAAADATQRGQHDHARLAVAPGLVVVATPRAARAHDARDGAPRWELTLESLRDRAGAEDPSDRFVDAVATPGGVALLATVGGARRALLLDGIGRVRWSTSLWGARVDEALVPVEPRPALVHLVKSEDGGRVRELEAGAGGSAGRDARCPRTWPADGEERRCGARLERGVRCRACGYDEEPEYLVTRLDPLPARAADGDGRLLALGDRLLLTADGLLGALGLERGELLWVLDRGAGLGLAGRRAFVGLDATAFSLEAVTAAGLVQRVDPLDGRPLGPPARPERAAAEGAPLALATRPLVLGWPGGDAGLVVDGLGLLPPAARPVGPGVLEPGRNLVLPAADGLVALGAGLGRLPWPLPAPAAVPRLALAADLVVALAPEGLVVVGPAPGPAAAPPAPPASDDELLARLDERDWRGRLAAWEALAVREDARPLLERAREGSPEAREVALELLALATQRERWRRIAPAAPRALLDELVAGVTAGRLRGLAGHLARTPEAADALIEVLAEAGDDAAVRAALLELVFRAHEPLCGRIVAVIRNAQQNPSLAGAAAEYLVELARDGLEVPLRRALVHPDTLTRAYVQVVLRRDEALRRRLRPDEAYWQEVERSPMVRQIAALLDAVGELDRAMLVDELTRALLPE